MADDRKTLELQILIAAQEASRTVSSIKDQLSDLINEAKRFNQSEGKALKDNFKNAENAAKDTAQGIEKITGNLGKLAEAAVAAKALSVLKDMGSFALQTADNFNTMRNQFGILLGDMEAGAGLFNQIKAFNDKTPFDLNTLTQATSVLIAAKVPLDDLQSQLTKFGDLSQGNSQKLTSYINAFSQAAAKGKADMQVLNTYLHQGVPILDALAKGFGVTTAEIVEMSSKGQISFQDFSRALDDLTSAGGQYFGGMELASQSLAAMQEGLREASNTLAASFGEMLLPAAIAIVKALTDITNAINESPLLKGLLIGAVVALTGVLAAMAIKAGIAFASQMALNFAIGALNPVVLVATVAAAGLAAGYTIMASEAQKAEKDIQNLAYQQRIQTDVINNATTALERYKEALNNMSDEQIRRDLAEVNAALNRMPRAAREALLDTPIDRLGDSSIDQDIKKFHMLNQILGERRTSFINSMFAGTDADKIQKINKQLADARAYLTDPINNTERSNLQEIVRVLTADLNKLTGAATNGISEIDQLAQRWKDNWADFMKRTQAEQSIDPFAVINYEHAKKTADAEANYLRSANRAVHDEINAYYDAQRSQVIQRLADEEARIQRELSKTRVDDLEYEMNQAIEAINKLEAQRIIAAGQSEEEIQQIRKTYEDMRKTASSNYEKDIAKVKKEESEAVFKELKDAIKDWQTTLADTLTLALMDISNFSDEAAIILGELNAQFVALGATAVLSGFEEFGKQMAEGAKFTDALKASLAEMSQQILRQLPMMFLQAGLQLIANGQWPLGLAFIAAAGSSALVSGVVDGKVSQAKKGADVNAHGGVYDEYGKAARAFAAGGAFTNQIVNEPTYFAHGGGLGLMGEAGPEAIVPLARMPNGDLGIQTAGGGANVVINIINNTKEEVRQEETTDAHGNMQWEIIIGGIVDKHISSGKADKVMGGRFGIRPAGV